MHVETELRKAELVINETLIGEFEKKVERMNKRAAKLGLEGVSFQITDRQERPCGSTTIGRYIKKVSLPNGIVANRWHAIYVTVEVTGPMPRLNGYRFIATVDLRGDNPVVRAQPFVERDLGVDLRPFFTTDAHCDHCKSMRQRNDVLVLQEIETGALIQIGRNCAADFFRSADAHHLLSVTDWSIGFTLSDDESAYSGRAFNPYLPLLSVMETAAAVVRTFGWVSKATAERDDMLASTRGRVITNLFPHPKTPLSDLVTIGAEDEAEGRAVMDWLVEAFVNKPASERSTFESNVAAAIEGRDTPVLVVRDSNLNFVIWAINGYKRELQHRAERAARVSVVSEHVGKVGVRAEFVLTLRVRRVFGGTYGQRAMCRFADAAGNVVIWWGTSDDAFNMIIDETYTVKATVKGHTLYEGVKQTELSRVSVISGKIAEPA